MRETRKIVKTAILICACFVWFAGAETENEKSREGRTSTWELIRKQRIQNSKATEAPAKESSIAGTQSKQRIVRFPINRSLGTLHIQDVNAIRKIKTYHHWIDGTEWEELGEAKGDVTIPAGKRLSLTINPKEWKDLSPLSNLGPDDLYSLGFRSTKGGAKPDDRCMPHIAHLTGLKTLMLSNTNISAEGLKHIGNLNSLERLFAPRLMDAGLAEVASSSSLKALYINDHSLTNAGLAHLARLEFLEELDLVGKGLLNDGCLVHLTKLPRLRYLLLHGKNFTDNGMIQIKDCSSLRILNLGHLKQLTDAAVVQLSQMSALERLSFYWNENITNVSIAHLKKIDSLKMLNIGHSRVTDEGLINVGQIKSLEYLHLPTGITDIGLAHLSGLGNLNYLWAGGSTSSPITDKGLEHVANLKSLEHLLIGGQGITDAGMVYITKLSNLKQLTLTSGPLNKGRLTSRGLAEVTKLRSLVTLNLSQTNMTLSALTQLKKLPNLKVLHVRQIRRGGSVLDIAGLTKLENLSLNLSRRPADSFGDADLKCLANLRSLEWLQIGPRKFTDAGMVHLAGLTELERLGIGGPDLTDQGVKYLSNMKKLNHLTISDGNFTEQGLRYLERLKSLRYLSITSANAFNNDALRRLRKNLPNLQILKVIP